MVRPIIHIPRAAFELLSDEDRATMGGVWPDLSMAVDMIDTLKPVPITLSERLQRLVGRRWTDLPGCYWFRFDNANVDEQDGYMTAVFNNGPYLQLFASISRDPFGSFELLGGVVPALLSTEERVGMEHYGHGNKTRVCLEHFSVTRTADFAKPYNIPLLEGDMGDMNYWGVLGRVEQIIGSFSSDI